MPLTNSNHDLLMQRELTTVLGEFVSLYPVLTCSCKRDDHPDPTCRVCGGSGRAYQQRVRVRGLIAGISAADKALMQAGLAMPGDLTFSPDVTPNIPIHDYDVIRLGYGMPYEGDILKRGASDLLSYWPTQIQTCQRHNPQTGVTTPYTEGVDFDVSGKTIAWRMGLGPMMGDFYSVKYLARFDWVVYPGVTLQRWDRGTSLGQRVLLRKRHLAGIAVQIP